MGAGRAGVRTEDDAEGDGPTRLCAVTRAELELGSLIRFVLSPDGEIVSDLGRRLPGRGIWVTAERRVVEQAARQNAFSKSLKKQVKVAPDLAQRVEALLLRRAGKPDLAAFTGQDLVFDFFQLMFKQNRAVETDRFTMLGSFHE